MYDRTTLAELEASGDLAVFLDEESEEGETEADEVDSEGVDTEPGTEPEEPTTTEAPTTHEPAAGMVLASEIEDMREMADMLFRQGQYESDGESEEKKAEFVAKEMRDRLDTLFQNVE